MAVLRMLTFIALASLPLLAAAAEEPPPCPAPGSVSGDWPELADIIRAYSKRTGRKFIVDPRVRATGGLVGIDANKITYEQLLMLASVHMFVMVPQGDVTVVVPDANARQEATPVYTDARFKAADDEWVTLLLSAKNVCAAQIVPILRPLMPQAAHMAASSSSNQLIISDRAVNARRIADLFEKLDRATPEGRGCEDMPAKK